MNQTLIDLIVTLGSRVLVKRKSLTKQGDNIQLALSSLKAQKELSPVDRRPNVRAK